MCVYIYMFFNYLFKITMEKEAKYESKNFVLI